MAEAAILPALYKMFSKCFYYPDGDLADMIFGGELTAFLEGFKSIAGTELEQVTDWIENFRTEDELLEQLRIEYTRMFITAFPHVPAPPYQSFYLENELCGHATGEVSEIYHRNGFKVSGEVNEPADHLALLLEFMSRLAEAGNLVDLEGKFIMKRIWGWIDDFRGRIDEYAALPFYPFLVHALIVFLSVRLNNKNLFTGVSE